MKIETTDERLPTLLIIPLIQLFVILCLFMALLNGQRDLTVLSIVVLVILFGSKLWSRLSPFKISRDATVDKQRIFPDETVVFSVRVRNAKILPVLAQLSIRFAHSFKMTEDQATLNRESGLLWYQEARFQWSLTALRRGVYRIGAAQLQVGDFFGFYPKKHDTPSTPDIIVYPRLIPLKSLSLPRRDLFGNPGSQSPIEDPVYVYGTREYQSGRPARFIHWKASARLPRLQEKICEPAAQERLLIVVDVKGFCEHGANTEFEKILEVAASAAVSFNRSGFAVGLATNGYLQGGGPPVIPVGRGLQQMPKILETLARLQMRSSEAMVDTLKRGLKLPWGISGFSLSYNPDESLAGIHAYFKHRRIPVVSVVCRSDQSSGQNQKKMPGEILTLDEIHMKGPPEFEE